MVVNGAFAHSFISHCDKLNLFYRPSAFAYEEASDKEDVAGFRQLLHWSSFRRGFPTFIVILLTFFAYTFLYKTKPNAKLNAEKVRRLTITTASYQGAGFYKLISLGFEGFNN